ncbi:MAG: 50S ribosomal protein L17 [Clostridia bacterium]|nr:50S ribosomal protein L17 [Clostridia bacterium]MBQ4098263.1 50S ribosomal protein L17 [Clostridia bacterium]
MPGRMGLTTTQRKAVLRNQASNLLWYGRIEVTEGHVRALRPYVEKIITLAVNSYDDTVETTVTTTDAKGKEVTKKVIKDGPKKLNARRKIMSLTYDLQFVKEKGESKADFKARVKGINHPLIEKIFNEIAPKYADRKEELGQGGGYTRKYLKGQRRGDAAEVAIVELV